jgi:ribosomal protein S18 acetylase RimI-like enzyme
MPDQDYKLDNPIWYALAESHKHLCYDFENIKFYHPDYCCFGAFNKNNDYQDGIEKYSNLTDNFYIVGQEPKLPDHLYINKEIVCFQMLLNKLNYESFSPIITPLKSDNYSALFNLVQMVMPGYIREKTPLMGKFYGIFEKDHLIAAAGKRMHLEDYTEVSSIVTHPSHLRKGYASALTHYCGQEILNEQKKAFLHVLDTNSAAIDLYSKIGFQIRRRMTFWNIKHK